MLNEKIKNEQSQEPEAQFFLWDYLKEADRPIIMYGTGDGADKILAVMKRYGLQPACFTKSGNVSSFSMNVTFRDYQVMPFEEVERKFGADFIILLCFGTNKPEILERLYALAEKYELYAPDVPVAGNEDSWEIYDPEYIETHYEKIEKVRKLLADEKSHEVFDGWLEYRLSGKIDILDKIATPREEMLSLLKFKENEVFIDAGAFKGDTAEEFLNATGGKFTKITAIEPDAKNYMALRRKFYAYGSGIFAPLNAVAWSEDEPVEFTVKSGKAGGVGVKGGRVKQIQGVKIDTLCDKEAATYIKIDVEGAEAEVLKGAKSTITKHRPKMLVSLYHRNEDLFELPLMLHSFYPKYKFYLRKTRCLPGWEFELIVRN
jgi:FkbM family methyltransferase